MTKAKDLMRRLAARASVHGTRAAERYVDVFDAIQAVTPYGHTVLIAPFDGWFSTACEANKTERSGVKAKCNGVEVSCVSPMNDSSSLAIPIKKGADVRVDLSAVHRVVWAHFCALVGDEMQKNKMVGGGKNPYFSHLSSLGGSSCLRLKNSCEASEERRGTLRSRQGITFLSSLSGRKHQRENTNLSLRATATSLRGAKGLMSAKWTCYLKNILERCRSEAPRQEDGQRPQSPSKKEFVSLSVFGEAGSLTEKLSSYLHLEASNTARQEAAA